MPAPVPMIGITVVLLLLVNIATLGYMANLPHPDQSFSVNDGQVMLATDSGEVAVIGLRSDAGRIELLASDFVEEPDILPTRTELESFFERQGQIYSVLTDAEPHVETPQGDVVVTFKEEGFPGSFNFWLQLFVGNVGALIGVAVWTFQRNNIGARHFCVTGIGLAIAAISAAVYSARSIALPADMFNLLSDANGFGTAFFCCGFFCMMWNYPRLLKEILIAPYWYVLIMGVWLMGVVGVIESLDISKRGPPIVALLLGIFCLVLQWRFSRGDLVTRQALRWFMLVTLSGSAFFVAVIMIPPLLGDSTPISQGAAFLAFLTIYLGLAVGVSRYPLFDLKQYWMKSLIWLSGGVVVIGINLAIVSQFGLSNVTALVMVLVSLALVTFPLRWAGAQYVFNQASRNFQQHLPNIVNSMSSSARTDLPTVWEEQIRNIFQPLELERESISVVKPTVVKGGTGFVIPAIEGGGSYHLAYADQGARLFNSLDISLVETLAGVFEMHTSKSEAAEEAIKAERGRLRKDLHDSLGGRLLTILHSTSDDRAASETREAMSELRQILSGVDAGDTTLDEAAAGWKAQIFNQLDAAGAELYWRYDITGKPLSLSGSDYRNLGSVLREAVTNAIKHAKATRVKVSFEVLGEELIIEVQNNGDVSDPAGWEEGGYGLRNLRERSESIGSEVNWYLMGNEVLFRLVLPLASLTKAKP